MLLLGKIRKGSDPIVTRAQGKQDPENHIRALPTVASTLSGAGPGRVKAIFAGP